VEQKKTPVTKVRILFGSHIIGDTLSPKFFQILADKIHVVAESFLRLEQPCSHPIHHDAMEKSFFARKVTANT